MVKKKKKKVKSIEICSGFLKYLIKLRDQRQILRK